MEESVTSHTNHIHKNTRNHALTIAKLHMGYASAEVSTKVRLHTTKLHVNKYPK